MDNLMLAVEILLGIAGLVILYKYIKQVFFSAPDKIYVGKETGARYTKSEQDLSEFR